jgi:hypothetical protein
MSNEQSVITKQEFPEPVQFRGPLGLRAAVWVLARRKHTTPSEVMRQFVIRGLEEAGVRIDQNGAAEVAR